MCIILLVTAQLYISCLHSNLHTLPNSDASHFLCLPLHSSLPPPSCTSGCMDAGEEDGNTKKRERGRKREKETEKEAKRQAIVGRRVLEGQRTVAHCSVVIVEWAWSTRGPKQEEKRYSDHIASSGSIRDRSVRDHSTGKQGLWGALLCRVVSLRTPGV